MNNLTVFIDGACEPINPGGIAGFGVVVYLNGTKIYSVSQRYMFSSCETSNNVAEYAALIHALNWLIGSNYHTHTIHLYSDSQLVVNQLSGKYQIRSGNYVELALKAKTLIGLFPHILISWIPREKNIEADQLSIKAVLPQ